jgi:hypothetical protein
LLTVALVAIIGFLAWRGARRRYEETMLSVRRQRRASPGAVTLKKDPKTGVYRQGGKND